ncbi:MAG: hypothetical protein AAF423_10710 [Pseudomonadota bacterium]
MSLENMPVEKRPDFNLTTVSTLHHLFAAAVTCALLWVIIAVTIGT